MTSLPVSESKRSLWLCLLLPTIAGGLGWGIRGQYGHETGALIPGVLVGLSIGLLMAPSASGLRLARIAALTAIGFSFGGSMTYGQTLGLTMDEGIRQQAYGWGLLGTTIKGAIWIALGGAFMGIGLSRRRYTAGELALVMLGMIGLWFVGIWLLNRPFDPAHLRLPRIYFSDYWNAGRPGWKPRPELWGGLLVALIGLLAYLGLVRRDGRAVGLSLCGAVAGGLGFTTGQILQAYCSWHKPFSPALVPYVDAWKIMEVTFGLIAGLGLAVGGLLLYSRQDLSDLKDEVSLSPAVEFVLLALAAAGLVMWNLCQVPQFDVVADVALTMGLIPVIGIIGGRFWPYFGAMPLIALPIAGLTASGAIYDQHVLSPATGWTLLLVVPVLMMILAAWKAMRRAERSGSGESVARYMLIVSAVIYTLLSVALTVFNRQLFDATPARVSQAGGWLCFVPRFLGSGLTVEVTFIILTGVLIALALRRPSRPTEL